ncbi:VTT domain-containing protein [Rhodobacterales bacterium]|nr:VTT domain-containing protein [Rhodobacterales bacterium]
MVNRMAMAFSRMGLKPLLRGLILVGLLIIAGYLVRQYEFRELLDLISFSASGDVGWLHGQLAYVVLGAFFTAVGGPRQAVGFFAAYFFGFTPGTALAMLASTLGCLLAYFFARLFHDTAERFIRGRVEVARRIWARDTFWVTLILRLLPVGSNVLANLAAGASKVPFLPFLAGSVTGYLPQTVVFALLGAGVNIGSTTQVAISVALFVASTLLGLSIYVRYRRRLRNGADTDTPE